RGNTIPFPFDLPPQRSIVLPVPVPTPTTPGTYHLQPHLMVTDTVGEKPKELPLPGVTVQVTQTRLLQMEDEIAVRERLLESDRRANSLAYFDWISRSDTIDSDTADKMRNAVAGWRSQPTITILMVVHNPPAHALLASIESVRKQIYPLWELRIANEASTDPEIISILKSAAANDSRIRIVRHKARDDRSASINAALKTANGEYCHFMGCGDSIAPHALYFYAS